MFQKLLRGKKSPVDPFGSDLDLDSDMARVAHPTKSKLVETATRLLKTHKPSEISVDLVLSESKISKGSLYHHFADLDELIETALLTTATNVFPSFVPSPGIENEFDEDVDWTTFVLVFA